jgi:alpha-1,3-glucan synthase
MRNAIFVLPLSFGVKFTQSLPYEPQYVDYNLNQNASALNPLSYSGQWEDHSFTPSPSNWRFPFYTLFLDRYVNGDPTNDDANETAFEHDSTSTQLRHGGDLQGLVDSLDYISGMGIKVGNYCPTKQRQAHILQGIYIAGSPFINQPWEYDSYSVCHPFAWSTLPVLRA